MGELVYGNTKLAPCTAMAAVELVKSIGVEIRGKEATIVGRSAIVGKPVSLLLLDLSATPTVCHSGTKDLSAQTRKADILIAAVGKAEMIKGNMIKPGAIVIDVGINRVKELDAQGNPVMNPNGKPKMKTVGDVEFATAREVASYITPVPGGGTCNSGYVIKKYGGSIEDESEFLEVFTYNFFTGKLSLKNNYRA